MLSMLQPLFLERQSITQSLYQVRGYAQGILLDIGCGEKPYFAIFGKNVTRYIGFDLPPHRTSNRERKSVDLFADLSRIPFKDCSVDTVLATQVLEHFADPHAFLGEIRRVLKPGGHLILTAPQAWELHEEPRDFFRFTKYGLKYLLDMNKLEVISIKPRGGFCRLMGQILCVQVSHAQNRLSGKMFSLICAPLYLVINSLAIFLDRTIGESWTKNTLGYLCVARKCQK